MGEGRPQNLAGSPAFFLLARGPCRPRASWSCPACSSASVKQVQKQGQQLPPAALRSLPTQLCLPGPTPNSEVTRLKSCLTHRFIFRTRACFDKRHQVFLPFVSLENIYWKHRKCFYDQLRGPLSPVAWTSKLGVTFASSLPIPPRAAGPWSQRRHTWTTHA